MVFWNSLKAANTSWLCNTVNILFLVGGITMKNIIIAAGKPGTGKSKFGMEVEEPIMFWDIENKNEEMQNKYYPHKLINRKDLLVFDDTFHEDWYGTYLTLKSEVDKIIALGQKVRSGELNYIGFEWLVIDGISPIRNKIMYAKWIHDHSKAVTGKPSRKRPNEYEWGTINEYVRGLLFPLINMVVAGIIPNLLFTAEFVDRYELIDVYDEAVNKIVTKSVKNGMKPAYKTDLGYKGYTLFEFYCDIKTGKYSVTCTKSLTGVWKEDVTGRSVFDVLLARGL